MAADTDERAASALKKYYANITPEEIGGKLKSRMQAFDESEGRRDARVRLTIEVLQMFGLVNEARELKKFDDKYSLGFTLLSDEDHAIADAFGVWGEKSMYGKKYMGIVRSAFLIDEKGNVEQAWYKVSPKNTPTNLLKALKA